MYNIEQEFDARFHLVDILSTRSAPARKLKFYRRDGNFQAGGNGNLFGHIVKYKIKS